MSEHGSAERKRGAGLRVEGPRIKVEKVFPPRGRAKSQTREELVTVSQTLSVGKGMSTDVAGGGIALSCRRSQKRKGDGKVLSSGHLPREGGD